MNCNSLASSSSETGIIGGCQKSQQRHTYFELNKAVVGGTLDYGKQVCRVDCFSSLNFYVSVQHIGDTDTLSK